MNLKNVSEEVLVIIQDALKYIFCGKSFTHYTYKYSSDETTEKIAVMKVVNKFPYFFEPYGVTTNYYNGDPSLNKKQGKIVQSQIVHSSIYHEVEKDITIVFNKSSYIQ